MTRQKVTNRTSSTDGRTISGTTAYLPDMPVRMAGALLALAVSAVHVADQGSITALASPSWIGWGYRFIEVGGVLTALALLIPWQLLLTRSAALSRPPVRSAAAALGWAAAVLLGVGPFIGYVASRSVGVPGDSGDVGNWGYWVGTVSLFVEGALVVLSLTVLVAIWQSSRSAAWARARASQTRLDMAGPAGQAAASADTDLRR